MGLKKTVFTDKFNIKFLVIIYLQFCKNIFCYVKMLILRLQMLTKKEYNKTILNITLTHKRCICNLIAYIGIKCFFSDVKFKEAFMNAV